MTLPPLVEYEVFRDHLGVAAGDPLEADTVRLLDAICAQVRRLTRRGFEGDEGGSYDQVLRIRGAREITLPWTPVRMVTSIAPVAFDGTVGDAYETTHWRLEDADRGHVRLRSGPEYIRVVWTTTGDIPADLPQAVLDWGKDRWDARDRARDLIGYTTADDSETYAATLVGRPPVDVLRAIMGARHATGGGVV